MGFICNLCRVCGHAEAHHGPISGRRDDVVYIPGRLCYFGENHRYEKYICMCSGFNQDDTLTVTEVIHAKLTNKPEGRYGENTSINATQDEPS